MTELKDGQWRSATHGREEKKDGLGQTVASHYNKLEEKGIQHRVESRIYFMRNLNNWIKSMLIQDYIGKLGDPSKLNILDLGCGKGGDLLKWERSRVHHVVGLDIAETSIEQCKDRYDKMKQKSRGRSFSGEFYAADCTKVRTRTLFQNPDIQFDLVSCQFAFHYCFESLPQAECMLRNASENLRVGGFFIGTTPCAYEIMSRIQKAESNTVGNAVYSVTFENGVEVNPPLFGSQYSFHLEGVVDCPEFLVYLPVMVKLAEKYGLMLIGNERFGRYFHSKQKGESEKNLLRRMFALEPFPTDNLVADREQYTYAQSVLNDEIRMVGTLSQDEWDALNIYTVFAFKKMSEPTLE